MTRDGATSAFWRARAEALSAMTRGGAREGGAAAAAATRARGAAMTFRDDANSRDDDDDDDGTREASDARGVVAWRAKAVPTVGATATTAARFERGRGVDAALDDAKSVEALRAGYKTLLREVTARHERARRTMEEEMETLRARVRALETERASTAATISGSQTRMKSPRREILAPDSPDDGDGLSPLSYELSPLSTSEMTPPPRCALEEEEEAAQTPIAFLPPRPPSREGSGGDDRSWVEAWERAQLNNPAASLPTSLRPGQGFVCPFTGNVVHKTP